MITLADLVRPLTVTEARNSIYSVLAAVGVTTTGWKPGAVVRTLITACAIVMAALTYVISGIAKSGLLDFAEGDWLTLVARHIYGVERIEATFATGNLTLVNTGGGVFPVAAEEALFTDPATGKTFRNTSGFTLNPVSSLTIAIRASGAGAASTAQALGISVISSPTMSLVTCSNDTAIVGLDAESDADLKARCLAKLGSLSPNGPADAYAFIARNATLLDGSSAGVTRCTVVRDGNGGVVVYVAGASGSVAGAIGDLATPLGAVDDAIQRKAVPLAVTCDVLSATPLVIPVTYELQMYNTSGLTETEIKAAVSSALATFMSTQQIGGNAVSGPGKVFGTAINAAISNAKDLNARPLPIFRVVLSAPAADVAVLVNEVPTLGAVTATAISQVAPGNL
jgi:uncharacterized phage protein gp47/JayE